MIDNAVLTAMIIGPVTFLFSWWMTNYVVAVMKKHNAPPFSPEERCTVMDCDRRSTDVVTEVKAKKEKAKA